MLARAAQEARVPPSEARLLWRDLADVPHGLFDDERLERALRSALGPRAGGAVWVRHRFAPRGLSLVGIGLGVRVALHTWPERRALSLDMYGTDPGLETLFARCLEALLA